MRRVPLPTWVSVEEPFLIVVGAILVFAIHATVPGVSLITTGWILMAAGLVTLIIALLAAFRRRRTIVETRAGRDAAGGSISRTDRSEDTL